MRITTEGDSFFEIHQIEFDQVYKIWAKHLWPGRKSKIKPISSLNAQGQVDMSIYDYLDSVEFWALQRHGNILAVNSVFITSQNSCRSRGLWVDRPYRGLGLSKVLLQISLQYAKVKKRTRLWTFPRQSSLFAYQNFGFKKESAWFDKNFEFGPNCLAVYHVKT